MVRLLLGQLAFAVAVCAQGKKVERGLTFVAEREVLYRVVMLKAEAVFASALNLLTRAKGRPSRVGKRVRDTPLNLSPISRSTSAKPGGNVEFSADKSIVPVEGRGKCDDEGGQRRLDEV